VQVVGLIPAAGTASRMRGLPKFMLPVSESVGTLIEHHVKLLSSFVNIIVIPTRPENVSLLTRLNLPENVHVTVLETATMSETVSRALGPIDFDHCILGMPDTYYLDSDNPYQTLATSMTETDVSLAIWRSTEEQRGQVGSIELERDHKVIRCADKDSNNHFGWHWGALAFNRSALNQLDPNTPHVGYMINPSLEHGLQVSATEISGNYFDCGTFSEYVRCLNSILA
jgi:hypothetical protein